MQFIIIIISTYMKCFNSCGCYSDLVMSENNTILLNLLIKY